LAVGVELVRVEPDPHRVRGAEHLHAAHARDARERVEQVGADVVRDVVAVHAAVFGDEGDHHQETGLGLADVDALALDFLRQQRHRELQLVLHLHLRDVRIGARLERQRDRGAARGLAGRRHVDQAVEALHVLLDDLRHRVLDDLRRRAGIVRVDRHRGRRDVRVHRDRQLRDREATREHDDDRDDPGEDRPVDEEA